MEHAAVLCPGDTILPEHLPPAVTRSQALAQAATSAIVAPDETPGSHPTSASPLPEVAADLPTTIKSIERARILEALERCAGSQSGAARLLKISRRTLISRIEEYGLPRPRKRHAGQGS
jgi:DNA-binding NtrC family response regulator